MKKQISVITIIGLIVTVLLMNHKVDEIERSKTKQKEFYETLSTTELNIKRFTQQISMDTEIILLAEAGESTIHHETNSNNLFSKITDTAIDIITEYESIISIPTNKITFITNNDQVNVIYNQSDFQVKSIEIKEKTILRNKDWFGKTITDDEVFVLEKQLISNIRNDLLANLEVMQKANQSLENYFSNLASKFNIKIKIN